MNTTELTDQMTNRIQNWTGRMGERAKNVGQKTDHYIRENTWKSLAVAALVGCTLGLLLGRRRG